MSTAPAAGTLLCDLDAITDGGAREFIFGTGPDTLRVFVVRRGANAWGYINECPHHYVPLNDREDAFVTYDHAWIICSAHAAVFRYEDGFCEDGPCKGKRLRPFAVAVDGGAVRVG